MALFIRASLFKVNVSQCYVNAICDTAVTKIAPILLSSIAFKFVLLTRYPRTVRVTR